MDKKHHGAAYKQPLAFDASTKRRIDDNGFLHVESSHITKEQVAPYYGWEIPDHDRFGLDPKKIYYGYRSGDELKKAVDTFNGLPLLLHHHPESAEDPQKEYRVGSVGTSAVWNAPYIDNALSITDKIGIKAVQDGTCRQISSAYQYDPDFTKGEFDGQPYDFIMRNIRGNHVALVEEGRAGPDVVVADAQINPKPKGKTSVMLKLKNLFRGAWDNDPELEKDDIKAEDEDNKVVKVKAIIESLSDVIPPEKLEELNSALNELAEPASDEDVPAEAEKEDAPADKPEDAPVDPVDSIEDEELPEESKEEPPMEDVGDDEDVPAEEGEEQKSDPEAFIDANSAADEAWEKCGIDSDDPIVKDAFAKGYGCGMQKRSAQDEDMPEEPMDQAEDAKEDEQKAFAQDAAIHRVVKGLEAKFEAAAEVGKYVGAVKPMAFDSVPDIYAHALNEMGVAPSAYSASSARDVFRIIVKQREVQLAQDANITPVKQFSGKFTGLNNIK